jgi:hypothetical protein
MAKTSNVLEREKKQTLTELRFLWCRDAAPDLGRWNVL